MSRIILGVFLGLAFAALGLFWWQGRERIEAAAPPVAALPTSTGKDKLPLADASDAWASPTRSDGTDTRTAAFLPLRSQS